jgi:heat shock protein HspQ
MIARLPSPKNTLPSIFSHGSLVSRRRWPYIPHMDRAHVFSAQAGRRIDMPRASRARFSIGDVVRHKQFDFRGVVFDVDPVFANSEEWYEQIPQEVRPSREQPFYHLFAENDENSYIAYVSQQNLVGDAEGGPIEHPALDEVFGAFDGERYRLRAGLSH